MHNPTEQEVVDLYSTSTTPSIVDAYLNPEYQYNLQLAALTDSLDNNPISINATTTPPSSFDLFWAISSPSFPNTIASALRQNHSNASSPSLTDKPETDLSANGTSLAQQETYMNNQLTQSNSIQTGNRFTPLLKYHRSVSQLHQAASSQRSVPDSSLFNHRASLPHIYSVNSFSKDNGRRIDKHSNVNTSTVTSSNNNCDHTTTPLVFWDQSFERNRHYLRPTPTFDESTRKRTKSMDNISNRQSKPLDRYYNHPKQLYHSQNHQQFDLQYQDLQNRKQQEHQIHLQQELQPNATSLTIDALNITGPVSAHEYSKSNTMGTLSPSYHQPSNHETTSPSIKSPISPFSSLSTVSSTNTMKNTDDDMIDKEEMHHLREEGGGINVSPYLGSEHYAPLVTTNSLYSPTAIHKAPSNLSSTGASSILSSISACTPTTILKQTEHDCSTHGDTDMDTETQSTSALPRRQNPRYDADVYTPRWVRYTGQQKQGYCESCQPMGKWLQLKNSAYWYHKQFFHGISSVSGQPFTSPLEQRINKETNLLEGLCHQCLQFVPICNTKRKNSVLWYRHAHKCHIYDKPKSKSPQQFTSTASPSL